MTCWRVARLGGKCQEICHHDSRLASLNEATRSYAVIARERRVGTRHWAQCRFEICIHDCVVARLNTLQMPDEELPTPTLLPNARRGSSKEGGG